MAFSASLRSTAARSSRSDPFPTSRSFLPRFYSTKPAASFTPPPPLKIKPRLLSRRAAFALLGLSLSLPAGYLLFPSIQSLSPQVYSSHPVAAIISLTPKHKLVTIPISSSSRQFFERPYRLDGSLTDVEDGEVTVQHVMVKSPDIQIERPYTPVNDAVQDGEVRMVVKRVRGGEVGRVVHATDVGELLGVRGPIPTFTIRPGEFDKIIMISTGTAVSPFLQLLSKSSPSSSPKYHLIHSLPPPPLPLLATDAPDYVVEWDWANTSADPAFLPSMEKKFGDKLTVTRIPQGLIPKEVVAEALQDVPAGGRVGVLVCLPPWLMRPLCGGMTPNLDQGRLTGVLRDLGLTSSEVLKLE